MRGRDVWLAIAEAYATPYRSRTKKQVKIARCGLWVAWEEASGRHSGPLRHTATDSSFLFYDVLRNVEPIKWGDGNSIRCLLACFMAAMTDAERLSIGVP